MADEHRYVSVRGLVVSSIRDEQVMVGKVAFVDPVAGVVFLYADSVQFKDGE